MATIDTKRQFTSHWHAQISLFKTKLWLCNCPEYLSCTKNITVYVMINVFIKHFVFSCCVSNNQYLAGDINSTKFCLFYQSPNDNRRLVHQKKIIDENVKFQAIAAYLFLICDL
jgi:hypothetical protein